MSGRVETTASEGGAVASSTLASEIEHSLRFFLERRSALRVAKTSRHNPLRNLRETFLRIIGCRVVETDSQIALLYRQIRSGGTFLFHSGSLLLTIGQEKSLGVAMMSKRPSWDDHMRMPLSEPVVEHIRSCEACRASINGLADDLYCRAYEREHRN
jgi:hypothetical protein